MAALATASASLAATPVRSSLSASGPAFLPAQRLAGARKVAAKRSLAVRATLEGKSAEEIVADVKAKWDAIEDKPTVLLYTGGAVATIWLSATVVSAVNSIPVLPKLLELVGTGYTAWFVYRYLLFKSSRAELKTKIEDLKSKIAGK